MISGIRLFFDFVSFDERKMEMVGCLPVDIAGASWTVVARNRGQSWSTNKVGLLRHTHLHLGEEEGENSLGTLE